MVRNTYMNNIYPQCGHHFCLAIEGDSSFHRQEDLREICSDVLQISLVDKKDVRAYTTAISLFPNRCACNFSSAKNAKWPNV